MCLCLPCLTACRNEQVERLRNAASLQERQDSINELVRSGHDAWKFLLPLLGDRNFSVRSAAAVALGRLCDSMEKRRELLARLHDRNIIIVLAAGYALMDPALTKPGDPDYDEVRSAGLAHHLTFDELDHDSCRVVGVPSPRDELMSCGSNAVGFLLRALADPALSKQSVMIIDALGDIGRAEATDSLLALLESGGDDAKMCATMEALGKLHAVQAVSSIRKLSSSPKESIRISAARALGTLRDHGGLVILKDQSPAVRRAAMSGMNSMLDKESVPLLIEMLNPEGGDTGDWETVEFAVNQLGRIRDPRAVLPLCKLLERSSRREENIIVEAIAPLADPAAIASLDKVLLKSERFQWLKLDLLPGIHALQRIGKPAASTLMAHALNGLGGLRSQGASDDLTGSRQELADIVAEMITGIGDTAGVMAYDVLLEAFRTRDAGLRRVGCSEMRKFIGEAEPRLRDALREPNVGIRLALIELLGWETVGPVVLDDLESVYLNTASAAAEVLVAYHDRSILTKIGFALSARQKENKNIEIIANHFLNSGWEEMVNSVRWWAGGHGYRIHEETISVQRRK